MANNASHVQTDTVRKTWTGDVEPAGPVPASADAVIIGGGIVGVSTAWFLARRGVRVVLCEKGHVAGEQSGRNWGWVRVQGRDTREVPMMLESLKIWDGLAADLGEDVGFRRGGCMFVAKDANDLAGFEPWVGVAREHGLDTRILAGRELSLVVDGITTDWAGALFTASDGRAEPHLAAPAIARGATRAGARVLTGCAVRGLDIEGGRLAGVVTEHGRIRTGSVLCAAGAWTSLFCRSLGITVPQLKVKGTVARTAAAAEVIPGDLFHKKFGIRRREDGGYTIAPGDLLEHAVTPSSFRFLPKFLPALLREFGIVRLSFGREFVDEWRTPTSWDLDRPSPFESQRVLDPSPDTGALERVRREVAAVFPQIADVPVVESWAGMIESTPDVVPVIDECEQLPGFHIATGFSGHGFGLGPGAGKAIAARMTNTEADIDLEPLRLSRFFDGSPIRPQGSI